MTAWLSPSEMRGSPGSALYAQTSAVTCLPEVGSQATQAQGALCTLLRVARPGVLGKPPCTSQGGDPLGRVTSYAMVFFTDAYFTGWEEYDTRQRRAADAPHCTNKCPKAQHLHFSHMVHYSCVLIRTDSVSAAAYINQHGAPLPSNEQRASSGFFRAPRTSGRSPPRQVSVRS